MADYRWVDGLKVTCQLTGCTPESASRPTLSKSMGELLFYYGKTGDCSGAFA